MLLFTASFTKWFSVSLHIFLAAVDHNPTVENQLFSCILDDREHLIQHRSEILAFLQYETFQVALLCILKVSLK